MQTLRLNDTGAGIDTGVWNLSVDVYNNYTGATILTNDSLTFKNVTSIAAYDLTASYAYVEVSSIRSPQAATNTIYPLRMNLDGSNYIYWAVNDEKIKAYKVVAGVSSLLAQTTYDRALHKAFRIRESGGTVYWDYSVDRNTWINFTTGTVASIFAVTSLYLQIGAISTVAGSSDVVYWDSLNTNYPAYSLISDNLTRS